MQDLCKGTVFEKLLPEAWGHSEGGWGFNRKAYGAKDISRRTGRMTKRLKARIANMPDAELIAKPIFRPFGEDWLFATNAISPESVEPIRARIVGDMKAIPGEKVVLAHSLGNMVVPSMIQDHGMPYERHFMLNAAVAKVAIACLFQDNVAITGIGRRSSPTDVGFVV